MVNIARGMGLGSDSEAGGGTTTKKAKDRRSSVNLSLTGERGKEREREREETRRMVWWDVVFYDLYVLPLRQVHCLDLTLPLEDSPLILWVTLPSYLPSPIPPSSPNALPYKQKRTKKATQTTKTKSKRLGRYLQGVLRLKRSWRGTGTLGHAVGMYSILCRV
ncbi:hypothetical protein BDQ12DRAFT_693375 [Crucibulum laeve]|uniref:Uncharacterized protein n=1 Tax=Crucibulum laeve TaxID=68775 RepID=A0A5C3LSU8_9AGAR|nr:hypothetical protein BDQ12DRAFT_693375 [Crucibulum laeve]